MKKLVFFIAVIACTITSFAQKINVAVYAPQKTNEIFDKSTTDFIIGEFVSNITHSDNYIAVNRSNEFLQSITAEHQFEQSGMVDEKEIAQLGKQKGAELICVVIFRKVLGNKTLEARMLDVEGAYVIASDLRDVSNVNDINQMKSSISAIISTLLTNTTSEKNNNSKQKRIAATNEHLYYVDGVVKGYSGGKMIALDDLEVSKRMVDCPEAVSLYNKGRDIILSYEHSPRWDSRFAAGFLFWMVGVPSAIVAPLCYSNVINTEIPVVLGSIFTGAFAVLGTWYITEKNVKKIGKNKIKRAVKKYNNQLNSLAIGVSPDRMGLVYNF